MDKDAILRSLPEEPPKELIDWTLAHCKEELGPEYLVYHSERVPVLPDMADIMEYNSLAPRKTEWMAYCRCTDCENDFYTQKVRSADAIRLAIGEDGSPYTLDPREPYAEYAWSNGICVEETFDGDNTICPYCGHQVTVIHSKKLRGGRTKRIKIVSVQNLGQYTAVFYWMICRGITEYGYTSLWAEPMEAYVLDEDGVLTRYSHVMYNGLAGAYRLRDRWEFRDKGNPLDSVYPDWGSINSRKSGAAIYDAFPDLAGTSGEKTGLLEFLRAGGYDAVEYLMFWRHHRCIENVVKCGQGPIVAEICLESERLYSSLYMEMSKYLDLSERKPHKMLRMSKEDFRAIQEAGIKLRMDHIDNYRRYQKHGGTMTFMEYLDIAPDFRSDGMLAALAIMEQSPGTDLDKIARYMQKQKLHPHETQLLVDVRRMAKTAYPDRELTAEELWPRNLASMHDRLTRILAEQQRMRSEAEMQKTSEEFQRVVDKYGALQWTDGELCIVLPRSSEDLHREGEVLRHCVGGYSIRHISGSDTIFFVRHYRRPERPYYTLDICMTKGVPREVQLHGYGNERHGINKEHKHSIPNKVRDFVNTWKETVLLPWYAEQQKRISNERGKTA
ncbi:MAG: PcfJ domain-containing protein [Faecousia sp.]